MGTTKTFHISINKKTGTFLPFHQSFDDNWTGEDWKGNPALPIEFYKPEDMDAVLNLLLSLQNVGKVGIYVPEEPKPPVVLPPRVKPVYPPEVLALLDEARTVAETVREEPLKDEAVIKRMCEIRGLLSDVPGLCVRWCDTCGKPMLEGYMADDGSGHWCTEECYFAEGSKEDNDEYLEDGFCFWTAWEYADWLD